MCVCVEEKGSDVKGCGGRLVFFHIELVLSNFNLTPFLKKIQDIIFLCSY